MTTYNVRSAATKLGYELGEVVQEDYIKNMSGTTKGTWTFKKKVLDKRKKQVILEEEKAVQPKPTRKRRTRSSTKKVSTED